MLRRLSVAALFGALAVAAGALFAPFADESATALTNCTSTSAANTSAEQTMLGLFNEARAAEDAPPVALSAVLNNGAAWIAEDNVNYDYFAHQPDSLGRFYGQRIVDCEVPGDAGEILAMWSGDPASVLQGWLGSPGHRDVMMNPLYRYVGIAQVDIPEGGSIWAAIFSRYDPAASIPTPEPTTATPATPSPTATPTATPSPSPTATVPALMPRVTTAMLTRE